MGWVGGAWFPGVALEARDPSLFFFRSFTENESLVEKGEGTEFNSESLLEWVLDLDLAITQGIVFFIKTN